MQSCIIIIYWFYNSISGFVMANQSGDGSSIKAINKTCVHKICSGQVVLTLATAVKELVENSLDAGATIIEVKLREYGKELLEVVDNGDGVKEEDFESLTLKHHTSKLENFSDLCSVETFGFRGEALSSLCALSDLTVVTCHKNASFGTKLEYDHNGVLIKASVSPRQVGTTVGLQNLFFTLPVRHKEFHRNLQKEFGKMVHLLTAYCLICTNKRITCVNQTVKGRKTIILSTQASSSVKENLAQVFGLKQANSLLQISQLAPSESTLEEFNISGLEPNASDTFRLEGYVSPCTHGDGRSSTDRQYFYINGRPCDLSKVSKIVNEVYHCYNRHQYPFVFLNVCLEKDAVDINVTPDKRQIFFPKEKLLLAVVKSSLLNIYEQKPSFVDCCPLGIVKGNKNLGLLSHLSHSTPSQSTKSPTLSNLKRTFPGESNIKMHFSQDFKNPRLSCNPGTDYSMNETSVQATKVLERENISNVKAFSSDTLYTSNHQEAIADKDQCKKLVILPLNEFEDCEGASKQTESSLERHSLNLNVVSKWSSGKKLIDSSNNDICLAVTLPFHDDKVLNKVIKNDPFTLNANAVHNIFKFRRTSGSNSTSIMSPAQDNTAYGLKQFNKSLNHFQPKPVELYSADIIQKSAAVSSITKESILSMTDSNQISNIAEAESPSKIFPTTPETSTNDSKYKITTDEPALLNKKTKHINFSMDCIKEKLLKRGKYCSKNVLAYHKFRSKITPSENQHAEGELKREISKNMFSEMEIIGQFNLGFIITKLKNDLFIIDQHATDEKYNFEILQRDTILETQKLLHPQSLEQTAIAESILLDNMHIFEKNGFKFSVIDNDKPGQRVRLVSVPVSHNWTFGKEDIDELIFMLTDNPGRMCRPSRISQMFASRSCRKSVMIGTPLQISDMKKLVCHMGEIEQPWNCPHGRPTIRHLFSMNILPTM